METRGFTHVDRHETLSRLIDYGINQEFLDSLEFSDTDMIKLLYMVERISPKPWS